MAYGICQSLFPKKSTYFSFDNFIKVVKGLDNFLFKLVVLRSVKDHSGNVWRRKSTDMYVIEITTDKTFEALTVEGTLTGGNRNQVKTLRVGLE